MKPHRVPEDDKYLIHKSKRTTREKLLKAINSKQTSKELGSTAAKFKEERRQQLENIRANDLNQNLALEGVMACNLVA
ncbi:hypothetical protein RND71_004235 [Anisodus tanguticus]|uniref:Uncharacterized protein n=1 Tax=Anisodus tanguticus TaxID=243964 RepID=A0AAE1SW47_9SOLA|nr:hypothetical protein RND71_004235 [Anisodus tanguticus]